MIEWMLIVDSKSRDLSWCPNINVARNHLDDDYKDGNDTMIASRGIAEGIKRGRICCRENKAARTFFVAPENKKK